MYKKFVTEVLDSNADVLLIFFKSLSTFVESCTNVKLFDACFDIIESLPAVTDELRLLLVTEDDVTAAEVIKLAKDAYQTMFLSYLDALCKVKAALPGKISV